MSDYVPELSPVEGVKLIKTSDLRPGDIIIDDEYPSLAWLVIAVYPYVDTYDNVYKIIYNAFGTTHVRQTRSMINDQFNILRA